MVNWAQPWHGPSLGGGVNGYAQSLALALAAQGHHLHWLCSGHTYEPAAGATPPRVREPALRDHEPWLGISTTEVINSPVLAPSLAQFKDPLGEVASPPLEHLVERWATRTKPDLVHWHNIEGLTAGCLAAVRRGWPEAAHVYSLHNYHTLCPQVYLLQGHRRPCVDSRGGEACINCVPATDPAAEMIRRAVPTTPVEQARFAGERRGNTPELLAAQRPHPWSEAGLSIPAWRPLLNVIQPEQSLAATDYGRRRAAMINMLNACDEVWPVSNFVRALFVSRGVDAARLHTMPIGSRMAELVAQRRESITPPPPASLIAAGDRPLRLTFMGYNNWAKGLQMLFDSLEVLTPEVLSRLHVSILALGGEQMERHWRRLEPRLAGLRLVHGYQHDDIPWLVSGSDLGVVPSVWWDNGPQTVLEFLACGVPVLGADLGGIPDRVTHNENGLLFRGNDRWDLARTIAGVLREPPVLEQLRQGVRTRPIAGMSAHAADVYARYAALKRGR